MAYSFSVQTALDQLRSAINIDLTAQGEAPTAIPYTFSARQYQMNDPSVFPLTLMEVRQLKIDTKAPNLRSFELPVEIHHLRIKGDGIAAEDALAKISHFAATLANDFTLSFVEDSIFENSEIESITMGESAIQTQLDNGLADLPVVVVSMLVHLFWTESRL